MKLSFWSWLTLLYGTAFAAVLSLGFICLGFVQEADERAADKARVESISEVVAEVLENGVDPAALQYPGVEIEYTANTYLPASPAGEDEVFFYTENASVLMKLLHGGTLTVRVYGANKNYPLYYGVAAACVVTGLVAVMWLSRQATRTLRSLTAAIDRLARGENPKDVHTGGGLRELATSFNKLKNRIIQSEETRVWFISSISHDLRTPLTSIKGFTKSMLDGIIKPDHYDKVLKIIDAEVGHMIRMTGDLMEVSRVETGQLKLYQEYVNISDIIGSVVETLGARQPTEFDFDETVGVLGDSGRLRQVFMNVIENAYKYNRPFGKVFITVREKDGLAQILVRDTGIGVSETDAKHIFEKFYRADHSRTNTRDGSGIGLYVVRLLLEMHSGSIRVESVPGEGSTFIIELPAYTDGEQE